MTTTEERQGLSALFNALDTNGDGMLTKEELILGYKKILKHPNPEEQVEEIMAQVDANQSGQIDYSEFMSATFTKKKLLTKERLKNAFAIFDQDGNGMIEAGELKSMYNSTAMNEAEWQEIINEVDPNGDGKISLNEFMLIMKKFENEK